MKIKTLVSLCLALLLSSTQANAFDLNQMVSEGIGQIGQQAKQSNTQKQAPTELLNHFMEKLLLQDFDESAAAVMPYVHKSNYNASGTALDNDLLSFSFKKAHQNAKFYTYPVRITRSQNLKTTGIGHPSRGTAEQGHEIKYWISKKSGVSGMPAPLVVFFPADGGQATISYMGSL